MGRIDYETETMIVHEVAPTLNAQFGNTQGIEDQHINGGAGLFVAHAIRGEGHDASEGGTGRGTPIIAIQGAATRENPDSGPDGIGVRTDGASYTLEARQEVQAIAFPAFLSGTQVATTENLSPALGAANPTAVMRLAIPGRGDSHNLEYRSDGTANAILTPNGGRAGIGVRAIATQWAVRRLTPLECTRLQGFPDDYFTGLRLNKPFADGPIYKMLGNSMAVNVMSWIGERIAAVDAIVKGEAAS